jgi:hypothetical protein
VLSATVLCLTSDYVLVIELLVVLEGPGLSDQIRRTSQLCHLAKMLDAGVTDAMVAESVGHETGVDVCPLLVICRYFLYLNLASLWYLWLPNLLTNYPQLCYARLMKNEGSRYVLSYFKQRISRLRISSSW